MAGDPEVVTRRQLNRTLLDRQLLLRRATVSATEAVRAIVGLQAQDARPPFVALWSRMEGFRAEDLTAALERREVVRATSMRGTIHVIDRDDYVLVRPAVQEISRRAMPITGPRAGEVDLDELLATGRRLLHAEPLTMTALRKALATAFPSADDARLVHAVRYLVELVLEPTQDRWGFPGNPRYALAEDWLGEPVPTSSEGELIVLRYLSAFGPATVGDVQTWSGLQALRPVIDRMRPTLRTYRDERGRELFDLPDATLAEEGQPAPVRFLAGFDNLLLSHDDRTRVMDEAARKKIFASKNGRWEPSFLVDGFVAGTWSVEVTKTVARLSVEPFDRLSARVRRAVQAEAEKLATFLEPELSTSVALTPR